MHAYKFDIVQFRTTTHYLSLEEEYLFRCLLDNYYLSERAPSYETAKRIADKCQVSAKSLDFVLSEYFHYVDGVYKNNRCEREINHWNKRGWRPHDPENKPLRPPIDEWKVTRMRIFKRDNFTCSYCGQYGGQLECDHVYPVSRGGSNDDSNLATACKSCNRDKSDKTLEEWRGE